MSLIEEIAEKRKDMIVNSYPISIGEVMNLYKDADCFARHKTLAE